MWTYRCVIQLKRSNTTVHFLPSSRVHILGRKRTIGADGGARVDYCKKCASTCVWRPPPSTRSQVLACQQSTAWGHQWWHLVCSIMQPPLGITPGAPAQQELLSTLCTDSHRRRATHRRVCVKNRRACDCNSCWNCLLVRLSPCIATQVHLTAISIGTAYWFRCHGSYDAQTCHCNSYCNCLLVQMSRLLYKGSDVSLQ